MKHGADRETSNSDKPGETDPYLVSGGRIKRQQMVNALNRINFHNGRVYVTFKHRRFDPSINVAAYPQPCQGENLELLWIKPDEVARLLVNYEYRDFFYSDRLKKVQVQAEAQRFGARGLTLRLPEVGYDTNRRGCQRLACYESIQAQLAQSGLLLWGRLTDFNANALAVDLRGVPEEEFGLLDPDTPVNVLLRHCDMVLLAESCRVLRLAHEEGGGVVVLAPQFNGLTRFKSKEVRSVRQHLHPQPRIEFEHPFFPGRISLPALDISGSGLAVEEEPAHSVLMPGMIIPRAAIAFSSEFKVECRAQVLFNHADAKNETRKCGLVFLDMEVGAQMQLSAILSQARDEHSCVGAAVDLDDLWDFFFETGFIYPEKYSSIQEQRDTFKQLYARLYNDSPKISRYIIYRDRNHILGHVSMFRYYDRTWLLHHHAAIKSPHHKAGLVVMDLILQHINEVHHFSSNRMRYIACYFRPNNRFAARVFGGAARALANPRECSLDDFAYFHYRLNNDALPAGWSLRESDGEDLATLRYFYREVSGGLLLEGLALDAGGIEREGEINAEYLSCGLRRQRLFFSLFRADGGLAALLVVNISDVGLNLSDLTNGVQIMVVDEREVSAELLYGALTLVAGYYEQPELSVLLFPLHCAESLQIPYDKVYQLTVLDLHYIGAYLEFMENLMGSPTRSTSPDE